LKDLATKPMIDSHYGDTNVYLEYFEESSTKFKPNKIFRDCDFISLKSNVATCLPNSSFAIFSAIFY
jgi:hypothetical protein